ncbi:MAG: cell division topological specificity factor MinE [Synergistaceae bacterium]|jgi:cell division topological specificity factor|nr:cell division topological specificity factor MinE [Synergistaceae bacterium]
MSIKSIVSGLFGAEGAQAKDVSSRQTAKERLAFIIVHDRIDIGPGKMDLMRRDIIEVLKKYFEINESQMELRLESEEGSMALLATIPINSVLDKNDKTARSGCSFQR